MNRSGPIKRGKPPKRGKAPNRRGAKAKREAPGLDLFRLALRDRGWCEAQGLADPKTGAPVCGSRRLHRGEHPHHVWPEDRKRGVHDPERGLWLCFTSHRWAHDNPKHAAQLGLLRPEDDRPLGSRPLESLRHDEEPDAAQG